MEKSDNSAVAQPSAVDKLKENSLKAAGIAYLVGDAAIVGSGLATGNKARVYTGLLWGSGGIAPALFGNSSQEQQLRMVGEGLGNYLRKQGVEIPDDPSIQKLTQEGGAVEHTLNFFRKHPSEMLNAIYALGATQMVAGGFREAAKGTKGTGNYDIASGALVGAGALAGLLIKERKPDPAHPAKDTMERIKQWAEEKPLRVSGLLYTLNNAAMLGAAISKRKDALKSAQAMKDYKLRFLTTGTYIFANAMLMMSSKNHHDGAHSIEPSVEMADMAARIIAAQPKEVQEALVQNVAGYLSSQPEIDKPAQEIAARMHEKLAAVAKTPQQPSWQERISAVMSQPEITRL
ncbi:MAG: hypothetical protein AB7L92_02120 [Alphaproteobacteria bacterium]